MGLRIHQLSPAVANQIAAGEVIERPASVVKELLENSLDAGANTITIEISYGGLNRIKISDNGVGIVEEDLPLAIAAHATSKITQLADLYAIDSMGFRGEALASIASVAKVTISSRTSQQDHAMMLSARGLEMNITPCARNVGTTIDVCDLFFNAPVRKRFLKNEKLEFQAIETVVKRFALSAPNITLTLKHNDKVVFSVPAALSEQAKLTRISKIFGNAFIKDSLFLDVESGTMRLWGWLSGPNFQRSQNDRQWVYVNQRMVKDKLINHALKQAYDGLLYPGRFPACLLYFAIDTNEVDVNVHPTKHEVRFQQPRLVHDFFTSQLQHALNKNAIVNDELAYEGMTYPTSTPTMIYEPRYQDEFNNKTSLVKGSSNVAVNETHRDDESHWVVLNHRFIIVFLQQQPYLVDMMALQQYGLQKQLHSLDGVLAGRPLLVPISYAIPQRLKNKMVELQRSLSDLGMDIEYLNDEMIVIRTVPIEVPYLDIRMFLDSVAQLPLLEREQLIVLLSQSQSFDVNVLSKEERMNLNRLFIDTQNQSFEQQNLYKILTIESCRMLLHV